MVCQTILDTLFRILSGCISIPSNPFITSITSIISSSYRIFAPMNSRILMIASAAVMAAIGLVLSFAPEESLAFFQQPVAGAVPVLLQLTGALYLGFAFMNWTAKGSVLGGIYGRAIVIGNFLHFTMGTLALLKVAIGPERGPAIWFLCVVYALFAFWFGRTLFTQPAEARGTAGH